MTNREKAIIMASVFCRDDFQCQQCGRSKIDERGVTLAVIKRLVPSGDPDNWTFCSEHLVTVCQRCVREIELDIFYHHFRLAPEYEMTAEEFRAEIDRMLPHLQRWRTHED